jgi:hypothetical protein
MIEHDKLRLSGKTVHGKNRIREHGSEWVVTNRHTTIRPQPNHKLSIRSTLTGAERWVNLIDDKDFQIQPIIGA